MDMAPQEVLVIHCSLAVSRRNGSPCHWIKTSQAERVGLSPCNDFLTIKPSRTGPLCNSSPICQRTSLKSCGDGHMAKQQVEVTTGSCSHKPARRRSMGKWSFFFLNPRATGEFGSTCGRLGSLFRTALPTLTRGRGLEKVPQTNACPS